MIKRTEKDCKFYVEGGKCNSPDAPNPNHSWCIGKKDCNSCILKRQTNLPTERSQVDEAILECIKHSSDMRTALERVKPPPLTDPIKWI